ncbi:hypothetical protein BDZ97DRAFT_509050 [Flammula alnicola]|nr:hypothetical protein BDZ97DRAFT_509050 [Flammula alnicola]
MGARTRRQDPTTSLILDSSVIASGFTQNGLQSDNAAANGFSPSLTSTNNFINYCAALQNVPLTNGSQLSTESCNPAPMGILPSMQNMPSVKFTSPAFNDTLKENTSFDISLNITNFGFGKITNPATNFLSAPQQLNPSGQIIGHVFVVIETIPSDDQTPTDPLFFNFFKTIDAIGPVGGVVTGTVDSGLPIGFYRLSSIVSAANHQPALMPVIEHGAIDDAIFFSVTSEGGGPPPLPTLSTRSASSSSTSVTSSSTSSTNPSSTGTGTNAAAQRYVRSFPRALLLTSQFLQCYTEEVEYSSRESCWSNHRSSVRACPRRGRLTSLEKTQDSECVHKPPNRHDRPDTF